MHLSVQWDDPEQTITRISFNGPFDYTQLLDVWSEEIALQNSVQHPVYSIKHFHRAPLGLPGMNVRELNEFAAQNIPTHLQLTIQVTDVEILRNTMRMMIPPSQAGKWFVVGTLDEARALIATHKTENA